MLASLAFQLSGEAIAQVVGLRTPPPRPAGAAPTSPATAVPADAARPQADGQPGQARPVLVSENLAVSFPTAASWVRPVDGVTLTVAPGEAVGIVGESR